MAIITNHTTKKNICFVDIPKNASTSIKEWLKQYSDMHLDIYRHAPISYKDIDKEIFKFAVIRNPYTRAISWYQQALSLINQGINLEVYNIDIDKTKWGKGFDYFVQNYFHIERTNNNADIPISPMQNQIDFLLHKGEIQIDKILFYESLDEDFKNIQKYLNFFKPLDKINIGPSKKIRNWRYMYTDKSRKLIEKFYERDLSFFDYTFD